MKTKKTVSMILCIAMALTMMLALAACGSTTENVAVKELGTYEYVKTDATTIEQGKLVTYYGNCMTIFSDNTFILMANHDALYSSDGGETYSPVNHLNAFLYGKYEVVEDNAELGEKTIKIVEVNRVVRDDYDSAVSITDADKEAYITNSPALGVELILSSDHKISDLVNVVDYMNIGKEA